MSRIWRGLMAHEQKYMMETNFIQFNFGELKNKQILLT